MKGRHRMYTSGTRIIMISFLLSNPGETYVQGTWCTKRCQLALEWAGGEHILHYTSEACRRCRYVSVPRPARFSSEGFFFCSLFTRRAHKHLGISRGRSRPQTTLLLWDVPTALGKEKKKHVRPSRRRREEGPASIYTRVVHA